MLKLVLQAIAVPESVPSVPADRSRHAVENVASLQQLNLTPNSTAAWTARQIVEAFPQKEEPRFLRRYLNEHVVGYCSTVRCR